MIWGLPRQRFEALPAIVQVGTPGAKDSKAVVGVDRHPVVIRSLLFWLTAALRKRGC